MRKCFKKSIFKESIMKKNLMLTLSLAMLFVTFDSFAVFITIRNDSNETIWARINDQNRMGVTQKDIRKYRAKIAASIAVMATVYGLPVGIPALLVTVLARQSHKTPAFLKIAPKSQKIFVSADFSVKKVTFLKIRGSELTKFKRADLATYIKQQGKMYGNMYTVDTKVKGRDATVYVDMYNDIFKVYTDPIVEVPIPTIETFEMKTNILQTINPAARIKYTKWNKAEQVNIKDMVKELAQIKNFLKR